jgi:amino acid adenylation domain-containing protein
VTIIQPGQLGAHDDRTAIVDPSRGAISYAELNRLADGVADRLRALGLNPDRRVGLGLPRSIDAVAAMLGVLRAGCAYVPVDPRAPLDRIADIHAHCGVDTVFLDASAAAAYRVAMRAAGVASTAVQALGVTGPGTALSAWTREGAGAEPIVGAAEPSPEPLACVLYTSGTTGVPKGWMMTRQAVAQHASWARETLGVTRDDVLANHAQFNFGMSLFDIFASLTAGARLVLVPDAIRQHGGLVADLWARERVSIWFSGPAILGLVAEQDDLDRRDLSALRAVAFAGEVFPLPRLNRLRRHVPHPRYFNFYGSTEANVAAFWELPRAGDLDERPPIGRPCRHYEARLRDARGHAASPGEAGELQLRGAGLAAGYWKQPALGRIADGWFGTGDLAVELPSGDLRFAGRIGRMIKLRGYRVEPGEIESRLSQHPLIREVGVVAAEDGDGLALVAHVSTTTGERMPLVALKTFCAVKLPAYMIPARFVFHQTLPRTSSGKVDLRALRTVRDV